MSLIVRNDEQIRVDVTPGLLSGSSFFIFDGSETFPSSGLNKPDYRNTEIVISEVGGRSPMVKGFDYTWDYTLGRFELIIVGEVFSANQWYNVHFQPIAQPASSSYYSLVNESFFIRDITIPNTGNAQILERLNYFIQKYEKECLIKFLGYGLYKVLITESSSRISELVYGAEFAHGNDLIKWEGLVHDTDISLIANYIYFYFQQASATQTTGVSTKVSKSESAQSVSPADKMVWAWNSMSKEVSSMLLFLWNKKDADGNRVYPEFTYNQYCESKRLSRTINFFGI